MVDHHNHHRPFPASGLSITGTDGADGPTTRRSKCIPISSTGDYDIYRGVAAFHGSAVSSVSATRFLQPFDTSSTELVITASAPKFPDMKVSSSSSSSLEFAFTNSQWTELKRQTMIYNYMMASLPVPPYLLSVGSPAASASQFSYSKLRNGVDLEPGRCRRTDGKKWRCSRDVAPDQKYCDRHIHRGRPRSRKPVELHANTNNNKRIRYGDNSRKVADFDGSISQPYVQAPVFVDKHSRKVADFNGLKAFASSFNEPRSLNWMMKGEQQWTEIGLSSESSSFNPAYQKQPLNLNSFGEEHHSNQTTPFPDETSSRSFIDAWSNTVASSDHNQTDNSRNTNSGFSSSGLLSLGINSIDDELGQIQTGLSLTQSDQNSDSGLLSTGGPLAEVLQLSSGNSMAENGDAVSPGILQKVLASFSDSSGRNSSPMLASSGRDKCIR